MTGPWAREFRDPQDSTWRVHLVRPGIGREITLWGRVEGLALRFENGEQSRDLQPVPPDWRDCDEGTLWSYCQQATLRGVRHAGRRN